MWLNDFGATGDFVAGGQDVDCVAIGFETLTNITAAEFITADLVGRIEIGDNEDFHTSR
jgi:hypothetical protein